MGSGSGWLFAILIKSLLRSHKEIIPLSIAAGVEHFSSSRIGPNLPGNVPEETSAELRGSLPYSFSSSFEGQQKLFYSGYRFKN